MRCNNIDALSHVLNCEICLKDVRAHLASQAGSVITEKKKLASRENGKLGGRPRKEQDAKTREKKQS